MFDIERFIFDIEREKGLRYRIRYQSTISNHYVRYRRDETSISTALLLTFEIDGMSPSLSNSVTFDIEHLRYRYTISDVKNVDIVLAFEIEVFDIECYARYRRSNTRYRGAKDPAAGPGWHGGPRAGPPFTVFKSGTQCSDSVTAAAAAVRDRVGAGTDSEAPAPGPAPAPAGRSSDHPPIRYMTSRTPF
jgi:hypothetical protein